MQAYTVVLLNMLGKARITVEEWVTKHIYWLPGLGPGARSQRALTEYSLCSTGHGVTAPGHTGVTDQPTGIAVAFGEPCGLPVRLPAGA